MHRNHTLPAAKDGDTVQQLNALRTADRQARLRALLPLIDELTRQGVSQSSVLEILARAGIILKPASLRQALHRWRRRQRHEQNLPGPAPKICSASLLPDSPDLPVASPPTTLPGIHTKADLVRLRTDQEPIDLNALAEYGRKK